MWQQRRTRSTVPKPGSSKLEPCSPSMIRRVPSGVQTRRRRTARQHRQLVEKRLTGSPLRPLGNHLRAGKAEWQWGTEIHAWWPAGAQLATRMGVRYAVIGSSLGTSEANGIGQPEAGTLEAHLTGAFGPERFIPTHKGQAFRPPVLAELRVRSGSVVLRLRRLLPERAQVGGRSRRRVGRQGPRPHLQQQHRVLAADAVTKTPSIANTFAGFARYSR